MIGPVIPAVNDMEIEAILKAAAVAGVKEAGYTMLRLPLEVKDIFKEWLMTEMPDRASKVMSLVKSIRGGKENDATFGRRMTGTGPYADRRRFNWLPGFGINRKRSTLATELSPAAAAAGSWR
jgi:DNA repair photolyase